MIEWTIPTMTCGHCAGVVTRTVQGLDAQAQVQIDLPTHKVRVQTSSDRKLLEDALSKEGYAPQPA
jgi:copper chaperone